MKPSASPVFLLAVWAVLGCGRPAAADQAKRYDLAARASEIDKRAKAHPEIGFVFEKGGKPQDVQHASVDTRVPSKGRLVIWLMAHNKELSTRLDSYGMHSIQVHYAREWFGKLYSGEPPRDDLFLSKIRLEAATGEDFSKEVEIPKPDGIMERSYQFVKWLDRENPEGNWKQFLTRDGKDLQWDKVVLSGASHGSTTAARMARHVRVDRVVMFSGPRDNYEVWQKLPSATPGNRFFGFSMSSTTVDQRPLSALLAADGPPGIRSDRRSRPDSPALWQLPPPDLGADVKAIMIAPTARRPRRGRSKEGHGKPSMRMSGAICSSIRSNSRKAGAS